MPVQQESGLPEGVLPQGQAEATHADTFEHQEPQVQGMHSDVQVSAASDEA